MKIRIFKSPQEYGATLIAMEKLVEKIIAGKAEEEIWLLEHDNVYTAGTSAKADDLVEARFPVHEVGRGGKYTYHGPGQRVIYFMLDLKKYYQPPDLRKFVNDLEEWVINSLAETGIESFRREGRVGIWINDRNSLGGESKIAALGIRVRKWVTFHGVSININPDLNNFNGIVPCGLAEFGVTSLTKMGRDVGLVEFDKILIEKLPFINRN